MAFCNENKLRLAVQWEKFLIPSYFLNTNFNPQSLVTKNSHMPVEADDFAADDDFFGNDRLVLIIFRL